MRCGRGTGVRLLIVIRLLFLATCTYPTPRDKHSSAFAGALLNGSSGIRVWRKPIKRKYLQSFVIPLGGIREGLWQQTLEGSDSAGCENDDKDHTEPLTGASNGWLCVGMQWMTLSGFGDLSLTGSNL